MDPNSRIPSQQQMTGSVYNGRPDTQQTPWLANQPGRTHHPPPTDPLGVTTSSANAYTAPVHHYYSGGPPASSAPGPYYAQLGAINSMPIAGPAVSYSVVPPRQPAASNGASQTQMSSPIQYGVPNHAPGNTQGLYPSGMLTFESIPGQHAVQPPSSQQQLGYGLQHQGQPGHTMSLPSSTPAPAIQPYIPAQQSTSSYQYGPSPYSGPVSQVNNPVSAPIHGIATGQYGPPPVVTHSAPNLKTSFSSISRLGANLSGLVQSKIQDHMSRVGAGKPHQVGVVAPPGQLSHDPNIHQGHWNWSNGSGNQASSSQPAFDTRPYHEAQNTQSMPDGHSAAVSAQQPQQLLLQTTIPPSTGPVDAQIMPTIAASPGHVVTGSNSVQPAYGLPIAQAPAPGSYPAPPTVPAAASPSVLTPYPGVAVVPGQTEAKDAPKLELVMKLASKLQQMLPQETGKQQPPGGSQPVNVLTAPFTLPGTQTDPRSSLATYMQGLCLSNPLPTAMMEDEYDEHPMLDTSMRDHGNPEPVSRFCLRGINFDFDTAWYCHPAAALFTICTWCHNNYIRNTEFAGSFERIRKKGARCFFHLPRMIKTLWPAAKTTKDLAPVIEFMKRLPEIPRCKAVGAVAATDQAIWFVAKDDALGNGFIACEECYEGIILGTPFRDRFTQSATMKPDNETWTCDLAIDFVRLRLVRIAKSVDLDKAWDEFAAWTKRRRSLPKCAGTKVVASSQKWYRPRRPMSAELFICEACFMDELAVTRFANEFVTVDTSKSIVTKYAQHSCHLQPAAMALRELTWACKVGRRGFDEWVRGAEAIVSKPSCATSEGIKGGRWYNFRQEVSNFGICEGCHAGLITPHGMQPFLSPTPRPAASNQPLFCVFNPHSSRWADFINHFVEAEATGVFAVWEDRIRMLAPIKLCPKQELASARVWYGWPDCPICEECYQGFARDTALAPSMPLQKQMHSGALCCFMYSTRMRDLYTKACESGSADDLLTVSRQRAAVYSQTVPVIKMLRDRAQAEHEAALANMHISATWNCIDGMAAATGEYQSAVWVSGEGYRSWDRVQADQAWNSAMDGFNRANNLDVTAQIAGLEQKWREVE